MTTGHQAQVIRQAAERAKRAVQYSLLALAGGVIFSASMDTAGAATVNNTFQVTATIISSCTVSGSTLNFGSSIDALATGTPLDATSTLTVTCSNTTPYAVSLNAGTNAGGPANFGARTMKSGSNTLPYQLYVDSGHSTVWGDGTASSSTKTGTGSGAAQTLSVYGRIPSLANVVPGSYTDTVTVTITY